MPVISTNTAANSAVRYLNINSSQQSESLSKLASGSRIVQASDDAAGLAISTRIQSDVTALQQAATNASHGISVLQTADGGAANISDILQRMKALASQSASGTVTDNERTYINAEFTQLIDEIQGTATSTRYNGQSLLDGTSAFSGDGISVMVGSDASDTINITLASLTSAALGLTADVDTAADDLVGGASGYTVAAGAATSATAPANLTSTDTDGLSIAAGETASFDVSDGTNTFTVTLGDAGSSAQQDFTAQDIADAITAAIGSTTTGLSASVTTGGALQLSNSATGASSEVTLSNFSTTDTAATFDAAELGFATTTSAGTDAGTATGSVSFDVNGTTVTLSSTGGTNSDGVYSADDIADAINTALGAVTGNTVTASVDATTGALTLSNSETGADSTLEIDNFTGTGFTATSLGFTETSSTGMDAGDSLTVTTQDEANAAIEALDAAINTVSKTRADIGATSSRFEFRSETIATSTENLSAANSAITDVDIASEQAKLSSAEVKTKAAVAAAATANQMPQDLLKLMQ